MCCLPPAPRACGTGYRDRWWWCPAGGSSVGWLELGPLCPMHRVEGLLGDLALFVPVAFDGEDDKHQGQDAEDQGLDRVEHHLQAEKADRDEGDRERGDDAERDLTAVDVAEEPHRGRHRLDELEHQLDETDEQGDPAGRDPVLELVEREELAEVASDPQSPKTLELEVEEADQCEAERDVDAARWRPQLLDPSHGRHETAPVAEQDQQEEGDEQRDVRLRGRACYAEPEVGQELVEPLEDVLGAAG